MEVKLNFYGTRSERGKSYPGSGGGAPSVGVGVSRVNQNSDLSCVPIETNAGVY